MKYASLQQLFLHKKILPLQTVQSCYRKLCIVVTEIGALLLPKSEHSRLPKSVHLSLPFTEVHDKLRAAVAPAQGQQLVAENAPLKHVREYLANTLHPQSGLRQVGIIHNKHCRKMALLIVFPYGHGLDEMTGDVPDDVASLYCPWP